MTPCFSNHALSSVLETFNANESGWGVEFHWPVLVNADRKSMAIIDNVSVVHTQSVKQGRNNNNQEMHDYISKYHLDTMIEEYDYVPLAPSNRKKKKLRELHDYRLVIMRTLFQLASAVRYQLSTGMITRKGLDRRMSAALFLHEFDHVSEAIEFEDVSNHVIEGISIMDNVTFTEESLVEGELGQMWAIVKLGRYSEEMFFHVIHQLYPHGFANERQKKYFGYSIADLLFVPTYILMEEISAMQLARHNSDVNRLLHSVWQWMFYLYQLYYKIDNNSLTVDYRYNNAIENNECCKHHIY